MKTTRASAHRTSRARPPLGKPKKPPAPSKSKDKSKSESGNYAPSRTKRKTKPPPEAKRTRTKPSDSDSESESESESDYVSGRGKRKSKNHKVSGAKRSQKKRKTSPTPSKSESEVESKPVTPKYRIRSLCGNLRCKIHQIRVPIKPPVQEEDEEDQDDLMDQGESPSGENDADADSGEPKYRIRALCGNLRCKIHLIRVPIKPPVQEEDEEGNQDSLVDQGESPSGENDADADSGEPKYRIRALCGNLRCKIHLIRVPIKPPVQEEDEEGNQDSLVDQGESPSSENDADADSGEPKYRIRSLCGNLRCKVHLIRVPIKLPVQEEDEEGNQDSLVDQGESPSGESDADADSDELEETQVEDEETQVEDESATDGDEQEEGESRSGESDGDADSDEAEGTQEEDEPATDGDEEEDRDDSMIPAHLLAPRSNGSGLNKSSRRLVPGSPGARLRYEPDQGLFDPLRRGLETNNPIEALLDAPHGTNIVDWHLGTSHPKRCPGCNLNDPRYSYRPCFHSTCRRCLYMLWGKSQEVENKEEYIGVKCQFCKTKVDYVVLITARSGDKVESVVVFEVPKRLGTGANGETEAGRYRYVPY
jgi:hypothetical protein